MENRRLRILLVESDEDLLDLTCEVLRLAGHEVVKARTAAAALAHTSTFKADVAILDLDLPDMSGFALSRKLSQTLGPLTPRLIAVSTDGDREGGQLSGFSHLLVKPYSMQPLLKAVAGDGPPSLVPEGVQPPFASVRSGSLFRPRGSAL